MISYAGIGSRETPPEILKLMNQVGFLLARNNVACRTGAALGADQAFANGANMGRGMTHLSLPWDKYERDWINTLHPSLITVQVLDPLTDIDAIRSVADHHPYYAKLKQGSIKLHARNWLILYEADYVICYTSDGTDKGGTGQGIRIAEAMGKDVHNLGNPHTLDLFYKDLDLRRNELPHSWR
jgi:hypothetical protein